MNQKYYSYEDIKKMQEHARKYNTESDKRNFLKSVNVIEQKMILLNNLRPYEVLNHLDSLNDKNTNKMLNELTYEEIKNLIRLFTQEDKKNFYSTFSQITLVNRFITLDNNAFDNVSEIELERKIELLDSSKKSTEDASKTIYESISESDREKVDNSIKSAEASVVVTDVAEQVELKEEIKSEEIEKPELKEPEKIVIVEEEIKPIELTLEEQAHLKVMNDFVKTKFDEYKENNPLFKDLDINNPELYQSLSDELKAIIETDFAKAKEGENKLELEDEINNSIKDEFQEAKSECEYEHVNNIVKEITKQKDSQSNEQKKAV